MLVGVQSLGRSLILIGAVLLIFGVLLVYSGRLPLRIGRLPGDFVWRGRNSVFYFPLATSILVSLVLSLIFWLFGRK